MAFCCVPLCTNKITTDGISLHLIPKDPHIRSEWLRALKHAKLLKSSKVCSAHFRSIDFVTRPSIIKYRCLKSTAVPSIFPWTNAVRGSQQLGDVATTVPDFMECEEILQGPVATRSYQYMDAEGNTVASMQQEQHDVNASEDDITWLEPMEVNKQEQDSDTIPSELLLLTKPDPDSLVPEDAVPESSFSSVRVKDELMPGPNEYIKIVDIQDIFKRKDPPSPESTEDIPRIESVVSLLPYLRNETGVASSSPNVVPATESENSSSSDLNIASKEIQDILKFGVCIQCQECKQFLSDMTVIRSHKCSVPGTGPNLIAGAGPISSVPPNLVRGTVPISALSPNLVPGADRISIVPPNLVPSAVPSNIVPGTDPISALSPNLLPNTVPTNTIPGAVPISALPSNLVTRDAFGNIKASECTVCHALFISDAALQNHMRSDHPQVAANQSNLVLLYSPECPTTSTSSPVVRLLEQPECIDLEEEEISQTLNPSPQPSTTSLKKILPRSEQNKSQESYIFVGTAEHGKISCSVFENDSVESPFRSPATRSKLRTYGKSTPNCEASIDDGVGIREHNVSELNPNLSAATDDFYSHFCKFHYKYNHNYKHNLITLPHLIKTAELTKISKGQFECQECDKKFKTTHTLYRHLKTDHPSSDTNYVKCKVCNLFLSFNVDSILKHLRKHEYFFQHFVLPENLWQCLECEILSNRLLKNGEKSVVEINLKNIIILKSVHDSETPNSVYFQYKINPLHPSELHKQILYSCGLCSDRFETQLDLDIHVESHVDCVFQKCSMCELKCENMNLFYEHVKQSHGYMQLPEIDMRNKKSKHLFKTLDITCFKHQIPLKFINTCSLHIHIGHHHYSNLLRQSVNEDNFECPICDAKFSVAKLFYAHCVPYTPLLTNLLRKCSECGIHLDSNVEWQSHLQQVHRGKYEFWCRICKVVQSSYTVLESHVEKEHNVPSFHCISCKTDFSCNVKAIAHLKCCNLDFICSICGYICDNLDFLINHLRAEIHMSMPKHQCNSCLNFFYSKFNLSCHLLNSKCVG